ncbi:MAG TPA: NADH-quinone oxidoreductase subunit M [Trueperaceae bacterium]|nr:NADH-quinone oxidoreductase subunit M [Trueperaceae bacterium]
MIALFVVLVPVVFAVVTGLAGSRRVAAVGFGLVSTLTTFVLTLFLPGSAGISTPWIPGLGVTFTLEPTGAGSVLTIVAALAMIPTALMAARRVEEGPGAFVALLLLMQGALAGIFLARDLVLFYVAWEAALIPSMLMLGAFGRDRRRAAVLKYLVYAIGGSFVMLISILAIRPLSGAASYRFADLIAATPNLAGATQVWLFIGLAIGMAVKLPLWPLHNWLIDFNEQNHPSGAADVAGTLYKVGGFGFFAWAIPLLPLGMERIGPILLGLSVFTALYGALAAVAQTDMKRLLAYASLSHMGIVGVGIFGLHLAGLNGAIFLLAAQMLSTGGLFLVSGMLFARRNSFDLDRYGGLARSAPALAALSLFVLFTFIGVPGLANFPGEFLSLLGAYQLHPWAAALATLSVIVAGVYGVNFFQRLYQGEEREPTREIGALEVFALIPLVAGILWLGIFPSPQLSRIEAQSQLIAAPAATATAEASSALASVPAAPPARPGDLLAPSAVPGEGPVAPDAPLGGSR